MFSVHSAKDLTLLLAVSSLLSFLREGWHQHRGNRIKQGFGGGGGDDILLPLNDKEEKFILELDQETPLSVFNYLLLVLALIKTWVWKPQWEVTFFLSLGKCLSPESCLPLILPPWFLPITTSTITLMPLGVVVNSSCKLMFQFNKKCIIEKLTSLYWKRDGIC